MGSSRTRLGPGRGEGTECCAQRQRGSLARAAFCSLYLACSNFYTFYLKNKVNYSTHLALPQKRISGSCWAGKALPGTRAAPVCVAPTWQPGTWKATAPTARPAGASASLLLTPFAAPFSRPGLNLSTTLSPWHADVHLVSSRPGARVSCLEFTPLWGDASRTSHTEVLQQFWGSQLLREAQPLTHCIQGLQGSPAASRCGQRSRPPGKGPGQSGFFSMVCLWH